jgi:hypothetical protein
MSQSTGNTGSTTNAQGRHTAGLLDIRNIIGSLIGVYGVILTLMGLFGDQESDKTGDVNANLWAGLAMIVVGLGFLTWARLRPVVVPEHHDTTQDGAQEDPA